MPAPAAPALVDVIGSHVAVGGGTMTSKTISTVLLGALATLALGGTAHAGKKLSWPLFFTK